MAIPTRILYAGNHDPDPGRFHYIIARNGVFIAIDNVWTRAVVPATEPEEDVVKLQKKLAAKLDDARCRCTWKPRPIPQEQMYRIIKFFREVRDRMHTEVAVLLHYSDADGWDVMVPTQTVTPGHVDYQVTPADRSPGRRLIGTMHSHVDMGAFHSGTDLHDEASSDGLHVTIGKIDSAPEGIDLAPEIVVRGERFSVPTSLFTEGLSEIVPAKKKRGRFDFTRPLSHAVTDLEAYDAVVVPDEWHVPVTKQTYTFPAYGGWSNESLFDWGTYYERFTGGKRGDRDASE